MELYAVGKIIGCFGIDGYLKLKPSTHSVERLESLEDVFVGTSVETATAYHVDEVLEKNRGIMLKVQAVDTRTAAESLVGAFVFVRKEDLKPPPDGRYFVDDIIGAEVVTPEGEVVGTVSDVCKLPGQDVWVVRRGEKEYMVPVVKEFIAAVDIAAKRVTIRPIEGLFDE
ncbi:MAG: 16S rRNA processing protein RimM [Ignavibacteriae bacterium]|nr:16S rRNA processing protein RimM [Ignavibacteria bacterium]MBI3365388.1 16S rRNA processing protein RimM [Ignavibacteriota bacterium]